MSQLRGVSCDRTIELKIECHLESSVAGFAVDDHPKTIENHHLMCFEKTARKVGVDLVQLCDHTIRRQRHQQFFDRGQSGNEIEIEIRAVVPGEQIELESSAILVVENFLHSDIS